MQEEIIHTYEEVRCGIRNSFPAQFFTGTQGKRYAGIITRYVLEEKLKWDREQICRELCREVFETYRLSGMLKTYFQNSIFEVMDNAYPGEFQPWEMIRARRHVFSGVKGREMAKRAVRWLILEKLKYSTNDLYKVTLQTFESFDLDNILFRIYNGSTWKAIQDAGLWNGYPWEIRQTPKGYWQGEDGYRHALQAVKWLIEDKYKWPIDEIPARIRHDHFKENGLSSMLEIVFQGSPYAAVDAVYPGMFKKWQFCTVGNRFWSGPDGVVHAKEALNWLFRDQLKLMDEEVPRHISEADFKKYGLGGLFSEFFHRSPSRVLEFFSYKANE